MKYTLQNYADIAFTTFNYKLPEKTISTINKLVGEIGITAASKSVTEQRSHENNDTKTKKNGYFNNGRKNKNYQKRETIDETWELAKPFKVTNIEKKEGIDKLINDIRASLNKISNKNYETQRDAIFEQIDKIISDDSSDEDEDKINNNNTDAITIANAIFDIASTNKFYSELYATLYKELSNNYVIFQYNIHQIIEQYKDNISSIQFVDPNVDYDKFCDNNKLNDKRKALTTFIVNLMKQDVLEQTQIISIIQYLLDIVFKNAEIENKNCEIEEITENVFIFISMTVSDLKEHELWENIENNIKKLSQYKAKEHLSISSRSIFKYMDILDQIKKQS
jgi:hypothetical protein